MNPLVVWAIICLSVALVLFFIEVFVPSGGAIGIAAAAALVVGVVLLFLVNTTLGIVSAIVVLLCVPFMLALALKIWPDTPIARLLTLRNDPLRPEEKENDPAPTALTAPQINTTGKALTELRPVGMCLINGKRLECLAERGVIPAGSTVRIVAVDGMQVKVRAEV